MTDKSTKPIHVAILIGAPLTEQNFERFGIPYLSPHFEVLVFDCLNWVGRNADIVKCKNFKGKNIRVNVLRLGGILDKQPAAFLVAYR